MPQEILEFVPASHLALDRTGLIADVRRARKGAGPGPSGLNPGMLRLVPGDEIASRAFADVASLLARAHVPAAIVRATAVNRLIAVCMPAGCARRLVVGRRDSTPQHGIS